MAERAMKPVWYAGAHPLDEQKNLDALWKAVDQLYPDVPVITTDLPATKTMTASAAGSLTVACANAARGSLSYQWQKMGATAFEDIASATSATYTVASWTASTNDGTYRCKIVNTFNGATATIYSGECLAEAGE